MRLETIGIGLEIDSEMSSLMVLRYEKSVLNVLYALVCSIDSILIIWSAGGKVFHLKIIKQVYAL